jgi:membrane protein implicated in regulation of membrane protease activity
LLVLLVVAGWAAYLIPFCLERRSAGSEMRSIHGFSNAMRILSRRTTAEVDGRYIMMPRPSAQTAQQQPPAVHVSGAGVRRAAQAQQTVRRRILLTMASLAAGSLPVALAVGGRLWLLPLGATTLLLGYVARLRRVAVLAAQRRHRLRQVALQHRVEQERLAYLERTATVTSTGRKAAPVRVPDQPSYAGAAGQADSRRVVGE